jgi:hypothetical protein
MNREPGLKVVLVLVGLLFSAGICNRTWAPAGRSINTSQYAIRAYPGNQIACHVNSCTLRQACGATVR